VKAAASAPPLQKKIKKTQGKKQEEKTVAAQVKEATSAPPLCPVYR
jgi:hypothetical protein